MQEKIYQVAIGLVPGIGASLTKTLISYCGSAEQIFKTSRGKLQSIPGIGPVLIDSIVHASVLKEAERIVETAQQQNTQLLFYTDDAYPNRLKQVADAPTLLYYKGTEDLNRERIVAIVGTRKASEYGKQVVQKMLEGLAPYKPLVISGLAYGIDIEAHKTALDLGLSTIGVMASGTDIIYPALHKNTASKMCEQGGLLSEYTFGSQAEPTRFPARNRIIAGMADATIVAEAAMGGGALITADIANSYDREVLAVPGRIDAPLSEGCNDLIKKHRAHAATSAGDIIELLNWDVLTAEKHLAANIPDLNPEEMVIYAVLHTKDPVHIDDLSWKSQLSMQKISSLLLQMEFRGIIKALPGKKFCLKK